MEDKRKTMPAVTLRNITILPGMLIHFDVSRKKSIAAVEKVMKGDQQVFLITQINGETEHPVREELYSVGTVAAIKQMIKLPGNVVRVLVMGLEKAELIDILEKPDYVEAEIILPKTSENGLSEVEERAMIRSILDILEVYAKENNRLSKDMLNQLTLIDSIEKLMDQISIQLVFSVEDKQKLLESETLADRFECLAVILTNEIEIFRIRREFQVKVKERVEKNQKEYILREQLKVIREELGESNTVSDVEQFMEKLNTLNADEDVKEKIRKEIERFRNLSSNSAESTVSRTYIETLLDLPWRDQSQDRKSLKYAKKILDRDHFGLEKVKERILEFLSVRSLTSKADCPIICLVGPPGTGKTSIARSIAEALNKEYVRICLGGVRDEAEIRGHRRTYIGAIPGRVIAGLKNAKVSNPLMLLDEIDKVSSDYKGDTSSALLEVLDSEQNIKFVDHYIEIPVDLSEVLFLATANSVQTIPKPLLDRMELIELNSYTLDEKVHIAKEHLLDKQLRKNGLPKKGLSITDGALSEMIMGYTREAGVRNLERKIGAICRKIAKEHLELGEEKNQTPEKMKKVKVTEKNLPHYLGKAKYVFEMAGQTPEVGVVNGLAWTAAGGDTLQIEVTSMPGTGKFELTGQMGDVMKESAKTGISFVRSISGIYKLTEDYFEKHDVHIHIPEGSVPKDGPSAGITMATAILSAVTAKKVRADVAMTGEITLRGRVLPIGGLKEKLLAAKKAHIKQVLIPEKNKRDLEEIGKDIYEGMLISFVSQMDDVLKQALVEE